MSLQKVNTLTNYMRDMVIEVQHCSHIASGTEIYSFFIVPCKSTFHFHKRKGFEDVD